MADGFEEIEALTLIDLLRRVEINVDLCTINSTFDVVGAHHIKIQADKKIHDLENWNDYNAILLPGGLPGSTNLRDSKKVISIVQDFFDKPSKYISAICAAPMILGEAKVAGKIKGTCYPGCEGDVGYKEYVEEPVVMDKNVITSMGPATAMLLGIKMVEVLLGPGTSKELEEELLMDRVF